MFMIFVSLPVIGQNRVLLYLVQCNSKSLQKAGSKACDWIGQIITIQFKLSWIKTEPWSSIDPYTMLYTENQKV